MKIIRNGVAYASNVNEYKSMNGKPLINNHELQGDGHNNTSTELEITWVGTQGEYNAILSHNPECIYIITDGDTTSGNDVSYNTLADLPVLEGQTISGSKSAKDYNLMTASEIKRLVASNKQIEVVTALPTNPEPCTTYYVGSGAPYHVYIYDINGNKADLGTETTNLSAYQLKSDTALTTSAKTVVNAINELDSELGTVTLATTDKTVKGAINELKDDQEDINDKIGTDTTYFPITDSLDDIVTKMTETYKSLTVGKSWAGAGANGNNTECAGTIQYSKMHNLVTVQFEIAFTSSDSTNEYEFDEVLPRNSHMNISLLGDVNTATRTEAGGCKVVISKDTGKLKVSKLGKNESASVTGIVTYIADM